ncbi:hypothetical protein, partial [Streptomyces sp. NPDC002346]
GARSARQPTSPDWVGSGSPAHASTLNHPFWLPDYGKWAEAGGPEAGDVAADARPQTFSG